MDESVKAIAAKWLSSPFLEKYKMIGERMDKAVRKFLLAKNRIEIYKKDNSINTKIKNRTGGKEKLISRNY